MQKSYSFARAMALLTSLVGWAVLIFGVVGTLNAPGLNVIGTAAGISLSVLAGVALIATGQITEALLDTAEATRDTASTGREAVALLQKLVARLDSAPLSSPGVSAAHSAPALAAPAPNAGEPTPTFGKTGVTRHRGYQIFTKDNGAATCNGLWFTSLDEARAWAEAQVTKG